MHNNTPGGGFFFVPPYQSSSSRGRRRRHHRPREQMDPLDYIIRQREDLDELERFYKERAEKEKKGKEEKKPPARGDILWSHIQWASVMAVVGIPIGMVYWALLKEFAKATGVTLGIK